jgi:hypothetical protein
MKTNGKFYIINERSDRIKAMFLTPLPVVWNRDGQFCIIPKAVIENDIDIRNMRKKADNKIIDPLAEIMWSQGIPISNLAGRALTNE